MANKVTASEITLAENIIEKWEEDPSYAAKYTLQERYKRWTNAIVSFGLAEVFNVGFWVISHGYDFDIQLSNSMHVVAFVALGLLFLLSGYKSVSASEDILEYERKRNV